MSVRKSYEIPGGTISAVHFGDINLSPQLIFLHATGFNALAYSSLLEPLARNMGVHVIALDMRGHGMSDLPADPQTLSNWHILRDDISAFLKAHIQDPVVLAGHSCGAVVSVLTAAVNPEKVRGLVSLDPVCMPSFMRIGMKFKPARNYMKRNFSLARNAGKRRDIFASLDAAFQRYQGRGLFTPLSDQVLRDYLTGGLRDHAEGVQLTCAPLWEQAIFVAQAHNIYKAARRAPRYRRVVFARKGGPHSAGTREHMRGIVGQNNVEYFKDRAHFFPLEDPEFTRTYLQKAIEATLA